MRLCKDGRRDDIMCNKWGFGGNAPSKLRPVLKARGASMRATRAGGTAKSLYRIKQQFTIQGGGSRSAHDPPDRIRSLSSFSRWHRTQSDSQGLLYLSLTYCSPT